MNRFRIGARRQYVLAAQIYVSLDVYHEKCVIDEVNRTLKMAGINSRVYLNQEGYLVSANADYEHNYVTFNIHNGDLVIDCYVAEISPYTTTNI